MLAFSHLTRGIFDVVDGVEVYSKLSSWMLESSGFNPEWLELVSDSNVCIERIAAKVSKDELDRMKWPTGYYTIFLIFFPP